MSYHVKANHKFFAVRRFGCTAIKGHVVEKTTQKWVDKQTITLELEVISRETLDERMNKDVEVINIMSGLPVMIKASRLGTCLDPSTERCYSM